MNNPLVEMFLKRMQDICIGDAGPRAHARTPEAEMLVAQTRKAWIFSVRTPKASLSIARMRNAWVAGAHIPEAEISFARTWSS